MKEGPRVRQSGAVPAPTGGVHSGDPILVGGFFGVANYDTERGSAVYFDATAGNVTSVSTRGNKLIGAATQCAGASDAVAIVRLTESVCERFHPVFSIVRANFGARHGKRAPQSRHAERVP
jgi:predicted RecA/RadA family phage recombinase